MPAESLWLDFKAGDREAYETVIRDYYRDLYVYGLRLVNNPDFIKDCVQDLFVHIWERRAFLADTDNIRLYLLKSLRNRVLKASVKEANLTGLDDTLTSQTLSDWSKEDEIISYEEALFSEQRIRTGLNSLPPRQREVIHLKFYEGLSNERIAVIMQISKPAVANLVHSTLRNLREIWHILSLFFYCLTC